MVLQHSFLVVEWLQESFLQEPFSVLLHPDEEVQQSLPQDTDTNANTPNANNNFFIFVIFLCFIVLSLCLLIFTKTLAYKRF